jgi:hypothetical protein
MRLHVDHEPGPDRRRPQTLDDAMETRVERVRDRLRRPPGRRTQVVPFNPSYTARLTDPRATTNAPAEGGFVLHRGRAQAESR